ALHHWALDILVFATGYAIFSRADASSWFVASLPALLAFDLLAIRRKPLLEALTRSRIYLRFATTLVLLTTSVLVFYPAMAHFEERIIRQFVETSVASAVIHHGDSQLFVLQETLEAIDRMEAAGQLRLPEKANVAYQIWSGSDLAVSSLSSSVEVYDEDGVLLSRFALNLSPDLSRDQLSEPPPQQWIIEEVSHPGEPHRPHLLQARRAISDGEGGRWDFQVRLLADWSNLPFITTPNPYIDLFRSPQTEAPLPFSGRELALYVFDLDGSPIFRSSESLLTLDAEPPHETAKGRRWMERELDGRPHHVLAFSDSQHLFALSYPAKPSLAYAAEVAGWTLLSALVAATLLLGAILIGTAGEPMSLRPRDIWTEVGVSFYGKLLVAFIFLALLPIVALAFVVRGVVIQQLETDVERAGLAQAQVVERFVQEFLTYQRLDPNERGVAAVTDPVLEWVGSLVGADVDLYRHGALVATSKRELFDSGLLSTRAVPGVYRRIVLDRVNHAFHRESVGRFHYLVVSVPIVVEPWGEPGVLSMPLASRQREIDRNVTSLNRTVLLVALCFCLAAAVLAYSLARRIAEPINTLTRATRHVAQGDFAISLRPQSRDEIGTLFDSFNQMTSDLQRQRRDLERTKKLEAWAEMARQIAHEVKNPLTPIQLSTEHLRRVADDPQVDFKKLLKDCTETILQQVRTLRQISMEFSTFASSTSLHPEPTDFGRLVAEVLEPYRRTPSRNVQVTLDVAPELPPIAVDRRLMQRTLVNLLENALHALNGEGRVSVTVRAARSSGRQWVEVVVSDDGPGIDPELREHVFEPYFSTRAAGTGLGLAIARKTVEEHGGTISLESEE
ncbi:MAG: ATP-binding protein, partial [Acidobacteriota bacterium]